MSVLFILSAVLSAAFVAAMPYGAATDAVFDVFQFPNLTALENIAVRSNGNLLVTSPTAPHLYQINPFNPPPNPSAAPLVFSFPNATALLGIAEFEPDVFAVAVGTVHPPNFVAGSFSVWKVDVSSFRSTADGVVTSNATASKITDIPGASILNGITLVAPDSPQILLADSGNGLVWRVDVRTGEYKSVLEDVLLKPGVNQTLGVNGIHIWSDYLYWTNTYLDGGLFGRVKINVSGSNAGTAAGPYEIVVKNGPGDDFTFDGKGNAYIATNFNRDVQRITPDGNVSVVAGNVQSTQLESDAALQFGRTSKDENTLYVVTSGGLSSRVPGTQLMGGKITAIDLEKLGLA
jgi:hypothetical protein